MDFVQEIFLIYGLLLPVFGLLSATTFASDRKGSGQVNSHFVPSTRSESSSYNG